MSQDGGSALLAQTDSICGQMSLSLEASTHAAQYFFQSCRRSRFQQIPVKAYAGEHARTKFECLLLALQAESKLVFVPSMSDAGPAAILPRPPLPEPLIADARELLPNAVFASNPCRIRFYNQVRDEEIVKLAASQSSLPSYTHACPFPLSGVEP